MGRKKGKNVKTAKRGQSQAYDEELYQKVPHSFVFHRGNIGNNVMELERDIRRVMEPYTARNLKIRKGNVLKDFVSVAGPLNVSHFVMLSKTDIAINLRIVRLPRGPTLTFKVQNYAMAKDIISSLKRPNMDPKQFQHHPLLVMNNMSGEGMHIKLMTTMFQNMFPSINVNKVKLKALRRCVLLNYDPETKTIDFRHYNISTVPVGVGRGVKKLTKTDIPNLAKYNDISEFVLRGGDLSESEAEMDGPHNEVDLPKDMTKGNMKSTKSAIRLTEIGPRLNMQLIKVEEGICEGNVLFHEYIHKTEEERKEQIKRRDKKMEQKALRRKQQEENVEKKKTEKEANKKRALAGMKAYDSDSDVEDPGGDEKDDSDIDDVEYYRREVGEAPDTDLFPQNKGLKRKKSVDKSAVPQKKNKTAFKSRDSKDRQNDKHFKNKNPKDMKKFSKRKPPFGKGTPSSKFSKNDSFTNKKNMDRNSKQKSFSKKETGFVKQKRVLTDLDKIKRRKMRKEMKKAGRKPGKKQSRPRKT